MIVIREFLEKDCLVISSAFSEQSWHKPVSQYILYWGESIAGTRLVRVAEYENSFAGYVTIVWESGYPPFRAAGIPEIVDLNVLVKYQHCGIGTALLDEAEKEIARCYRTAGIGVGLTSDYGRAQTLYIQRGYIPDGRGVFSHGRWLQYGDQVIIDDDVAFYLTKNLTPSET